MDASLDQLRAGGRDVRDEDIAGLLSAGLQPYQQACRYAYIAEKGCRGELRPLRDPMTACDDDG